jgi:hypothetical protein
MTIAGLPENVRVRCRESNIGSKSTLLEIARQFDDEAMHKFLDDLNQGKVVPRSKQPKAPAPKSPEPKTEALKPAAPPEVPETNGYTFVYTGHEPDFKLVMTFDQMESASRGEILRALKQAFDSVKNESVT